MRLKLLKSILAGFGAVLVWSSSSFALNSWKVSDLSGDVSVVRGNGQTPAAIGSDIASGDSMTINEGAWVELVFSGTCEVWELKGGRQYTFTEREILGSPKGDKIAPIHRLSICFDPGAFSTGKAQRIGGIIERGGSPEEELSEIGSQSNAALINLVILHALKNNDIEKARPYYEALKQRAPGSQFVAGVSKVFEKKTP